ncbi:ATP-binding protein [Treponema sp.]|uniref:ATP-binding protein n=1 Tax=Treponema sp. TaxID=166 RepID=UPI003FD8782E
MITDEVGHCVFDKENTRLFFDLVDRRYNKEGPYNMIFTNNKQLSQWKQNFCEDDSLLCALDRIFDDALIFNLRGYFRIAHLPIKQDILFPACGSGIFLQVHQVLYSFR